MILSNHPFNTRLASLVFAIGFFCSCATTNVNVDAFIADKDYDNALTAIEVELEKNPNQPDLYFLKATINGKLADQVSVYERKPFYENMIEALDETNIMAIEDSSFQDKADNLALGYWTKEYNNGLKSYEAGSKNNVYDESIAHFQNSISIKPTEIKGYKSLSIAQYNSGDIDIAIETLNEARFVVENEAELFEDLGFLYLEVGNAEQSAYYYNLANTDIVKNKNVAFGLVNAYIAAENNADALDLLNQLVNYYPKDAKLHNVYGTQLYNEASNLFDELTAAYVTYDSSSVESIKVEIEGVSELAEKEFIKAYSTDTSDVEFIESLAVFYNNMAGNYFSLMKTSFDEDNSAIKGKALTLVDFAITYYTSLASLAPQNDLIDNKIRTLKTLKSSWATTE